MTDATDHPPHAGLSLTTLEHADSLESLTLAYALPGEDKPLPLARHVLGEAPIDADALVERLHVLFGWRPGGGGSARWCHLATAFDGLCMRIDPVRTPAAEDVFEMLVDPGLSRRLDDWTEGRQIAYLRRLCDWIERNQELPEWLPQFTGRARQMASFDIDNWRDAFVIFPAFANIHPHWWEWGLSMRDRYAMVESPAQADARDANIAAWPDDDPMKPAALAAHDALLLLAGRQA